MPEVLLQRAFEVRGGDFDKAGETSSEIKALLKEVGIDPTLIRRAGVVTFEAEMNVVMYAESATVVFTLSDEDISIEVFDRGPGIADVDLAMQEGYSTATDEMRQMGFGFGMGLPNIKKNSDIFKLESEVGKGTRLYSAIRLDGAS
ncbi:MAG: anti-sigma regulatory factor [Candidatus Aminicenantes bacterium]|nr:anti-sigma regulatory factor [Candidatus Aminicenantes bacterium]